MRKSLACVTMLVLLAGLGQARAQEPASPEKIAALIKDLGAERYDLRQSATEALKAIGMPALKALQTAAESDDPEVRTRARAIIADVRLGITKDWPADLALLARHYDQITDRNERRNALRRIADALKAKAVPFLVVRMASPEADEANYALDTFRRFDTAEASQAVVDLIDKPATVQQTRALALAYARVGRTIDALKLLSTGDIDESTRRRVTEDSVKRLLELRGQGQFKELASSAEALAGACPDEARFLYLWADALEALEEDAKATGLREKALALNADRENVHYTVGQLLTDLGSYRLAEKEWLAILKVPPVDGVYDINAYMRLGSIYEQSDLYEKAADALDKGLTAFVAARAAGHGMGLAGAREEDIRKQIDELRVKAKGEPAKADAAVKDRVGADWLHVNVNIRIKDDKLEEYRKELATTVGRMDMTVEPAGLRLFDVAPVTLRYDAAKKEITVLLNGSACSKPAHFEAAGDRFRIAVSSLDRCYIFEMDATTGESKKLSSYEKDYTVRVEPGLKVAALTGVTFKLDDKEYKWEEVLKGVEVDYLAGELSVSVEGTTPKGKHFSRHVKIRVKEPPVEPVKTSAPDSSRPPTVVPRPTRVFVN